MIKLLQYANYAVSVYDIFLTLYFGLSLIIPTEEIRKNIDELFNFIEKNEIKCYNIPPSVLKLLPKKKLKNLKTILIVGESLWLWNNEILEWKCWKFY